MDLSEIVPQGSIPKKEVWDYFLWLRPKLSRN